MPAIVFLSLFLGLVSGVQIVNLHATPDVRSVRFEMDGRTIGAFTSAPWRGVLDVGSGLRPRELTAIALDASGQEIARATQVLNLPRPPAEVELVLEPRSVLVRTLHREHLTPKSLVLRLDGRKLEVGSNRRAALPKLNERMPHILSVEVRFPDGAVARKEAVISAQSGYTDAAVSELTPVVFSTRAARDGAYDSCFLSDGQSVRVSAVEETRPIVYFVKDTDSKEVSSVLEREKKRRGRKVFTAARKQMRLHHNTVMRIQWPLTTVYATPGELTMNVFAPSREYEPKDVDVHELLTGMPLPGREGEPRRFADAVASAALAAMGEGRRRAIVLMLSSKADASAYLPSDIREFLSAVGVPLFVWSPGPPGPATRTWGSVVDVSSLEGLAAATAAVNESIVTQRVAWLAAPPLRALNVKPAPGCDIRMLATR